MFYRHHLFGRTAEIANQYLSRGKKVLVEGRLKLDQWTDQQSIKRSKHSITVETLQMIDTRSQTPQTTPTHNGVPCEVTGPDGQPLPHDINDDEIPF